MRYVLLLESAYDNGKLLSFGHRAFRLWVNSLSYSRKHKTDGHMTPAQAEVLLRLYRLGKADVDELVAKGGWERVEDGYLIHDFLEVNPSEADLGGVSGSRSTAGRLGGLASAAARRSKSEANASKQTADEPPPKRSKTKLDVEVEQELEVDVEASTSEHPLPETDSHAVEAFAPSAHQTDQEPASGSRSSYDAEFAAWWVPYPRKRGKHEAEKAYAARRRAGRPAAALLRAVRNYAEHFDRVDGDVEFVPYPATFLNRHEDEEWEAGPPPDAIATGRRKVPNGSTRPEAYDALADAYADLDPMRAANQSGRLALEAG